jgi:hypothetical protein
MELQEAYFLYLLILHQKKHQGLRLHQIHHYLVFVLLLLRLLY